MSTYFAILLSNETIKCVRILTAVNTKVTFSQWLQNELTARGMSQADLARKSGLTTGAISNLINDVRHPSVEALLAIAKALKLPADALFRIAGILPETAETSVEDEELLFLFNQLSTNDQQELLEIARMKVSRRGNAKTSRISKPPIPADR